MNHISLLPKTDHLHADGWELVHNFPSLSSETNWSLPIITLRDELRHRVGGGGGIIFKEKFLKNRIDSYAAKNTRAHRVSSMGLNPSFVIIPVTENTEPKCHP